MMSQAPETLILAHNLGKDMMPDTGQLDERNGTPSQPESEFDDFSRYSSHHPSTEFVAVPGTSVGARASTNTLGGAGTTKGGHSRGRWVDRILVKFRLRKPSTTEIEFDTQSQKSGFQKGLSARFKRGLFRSKKNTGKGPAEIPHRTSTHDGVETSLINRNTKDLVVSTTTPNRLSVLTEHPQPLLSSLQGHSPDQQQFLFEPEDDHELHSQITRRQDHFTGVSNPQALVGKDEPLLSRTSGIYGRGQGQNQRQSPTSYDIDERCAASFRPNQPLNGQTTPGADVSDPRRRSTGMSLTTARVSALGKNGGLKPTRSATMRPHRQVTAGWLASLPPPACADSSEGLYPPGPMTELEAYRQQPQHQPSFNILHPGGGENIPHALFNQYLASSRHPIADAHAGDWRRRTAGGFPIPERYSSRWRPRSRCPSSRRRASVDSRQTTYNPFDLPKIPRQPLFKDIVDLLSLPRAVKEGNSPGSNSPSENHIRAGTSHYPDDHTTNHRLITVQANGGDRLDSFASTISYGDKNSKSTAIDRRCSTGPGSSLAQQTSSSSVGCSGSTVTNPTVTTIPPLFQKELPSPEQNGGNDGLGSFGLPEPAVAVAVTENEREDGQSRKGLLGSSFNASAAAYTGTGAAAGPQKTTAAPHHIQTPPLAGKSSVNKFTFGTPPSQVSPLPAHHRVTPTTGSSGGQSGTSGSASGDSSVHEAWWRPIQQGQELHQQQQQQQQRQGQLFPFGPGLGNGNRNRAGGGGGYPPPYGNSSLMRPPTPSSPMLRRIEKWNMRKRRQEMVREVGDGSGGVGVGGRR